MQIKHKDKVFPVFSSEFICVYIIAISIWSLITDLGKVHQVLYTLYLCLLHTILFLRRYRNHMQPILLVNALDFSPEFRNGL